MPRITVEDWLEISTDLEVNDYIEDCSDEEKQEIVKILQEEGYCVLPLTRNSRVSVAEAHYQEAVNKLLPSWNRLSKEDEETILRIANKL